MRAPVRHDTLITRLDFRSQRLRYMREVLRLTRPVRVVDVGGTPEAWQHPEAPRTSLLALVNLSFYEDQLSACHERGIAAIRGDARRLPLADGAADLLFSNSLIEHLHSWEHQQRFAAEARRVGRALWIQTPAMGFPLEPHWLGIGVHWLPKAIRRRLVRWITAHGLLDKPTAARVDEMIEEIRLLTRREMRRLFPDCEIWTERWYGLPKSHIAYRPSPATQQTRH